MTGSGVERVPLGKAAACWMCGLPAVCGERLPGRSHKVRWLCQRHADAVFGTQDPPWKRLDAKTQRDIVNEWLRAMTIMASGAGRPLEEVFAEIAAVNDAGTETIAMVTPLMPGEALDMRETGRAMTRLRSRETMVHALVTRILIGWCATATGQTRGEVLQRLALELDARLGEPGQRPDGTA
jgi:hypothetical protein